MEMKQDLKQIIVTCTICYSCSYIVRIIKEDLDVHCMHEELHTKVCWKTTWQPGHMGGKAFPVLI
jgi:hypothetical protein